MEALAGAGYRAIAPDMRGSGRTSAPADRQEYTQEKICGDVVGLLDSLQLPKAVIVGHDWGSVVAWNMGLHHPDRVIAAAGINAPGIAHVQLPISALDLMRAAPGIWDYQLYFQEPGVAEAELERDVERFIKLMIRSSRAEDEYDILYGFDTAQERGGILVGYPEQPSRSAMLTEEDLAYVVREHTRTGFRGALNWYRVHDQNFQWGKSVIGRRIEQPVLVVTVGKDPVMTADLTDGMERLAPSLTRRHIDQSSHWTQLEHPEWLSDQLISWLRGLGRARTKES